MFLLLLLTMPGCQTAWSWPGKLFARRTASTVEGMARNNAPPSGAASVAAASSGNSAAPAESSDNAVVQASTDRLGSAASASSSGGPEQAPSNEVITELQRIAEIDPAAQQHLLRELQQVEAEDWALTARNFRSALEYREQLRGGAADGPGDMKDRRVQTADQRGSQNWPNGNGNTTQPAPQQNPSPGQNALPDGSPIQPAGAPNNGPPSSPPASDTPFNGLLDPRRVRAEAETGRLMADRSAQGDRLIDPAAVATVAAASDDYPAGSPANGVQRVSYEQTPATAAADTNVVQHAAGSENAAVGQDVADWQEHLRLAIAQMNPVGGGEFPESTDAVRELFRLRMLQLAAGNNEEAVRPVAGASPPEQDFWSKGMFALSAFLNDNPQLNDEQRASAAALHLGSALDSLGELSKLSLVNLAYCTEVHGFGAYEPRAGDRFRPGDEVLLYVEVKNYHSRQTSTGFYTSLGGSYELIDAEGRHVDSHQFPVVEDNCRSRRRDFHIKYGLVLPADIAPESYQLQIVIRDNLNQRIGRSSIALEVVEK